MKKTILNKRFLSEVEHVMSSNQWSTSVTLTLSNQFTYFHFTIKHGVILGGNSSNIGKIFTVQKKIIRNMAGAQHRTSCRSLLKQLQIPPVPCKCILSLMNCIINNQENFQTNSSIHNINTRNKHHFR
jgi:hypothetical protein